MATYIISDFLAFSLGVGVVVVGQHAIGIIAWVIARPIIWLRRRHGD